MEILEIKRTRLEAHDCNEYYRCIKHHGEMEYKRGRWGTEKEEEVAIKFIKNSKEVFKELNIQRAMFINKASGLSSIHSSGMVHRDLHSGNILQHNQKWVEIGDVELCQPTNNEATTGKAPRSKRYLE
ncbi:hypothetical protein G9A89_006790 [Geosiphon pyriformis]|nr:hypothetical protein G9A89_006790 [Geosiphon pyriformis]